MVFLIPITEVEIGLKSRFLLSGNCGLWSNSHKIGTGDGCCTFFHMTILVSDSEIFSVLALTWVGLALISSITISRISMTLLSTSIAYLSSSFTRESKLSIGGSFKGGRKVLKLVPDIAEVRGRLEEAVEPLTCFTGVEALVCKLPILPFGPRLGLSS